MEVLDPAFESMVPSNAALERLHTGSRWCEGPVWFGDSRCLLWSDIPNDRILRWCEENEIRRVSYRDDLATELAAEPFDYLFSITNLSIIPEAVLALPRRQAINFHDGPLPRYAGLRAPAWALSRTRPSARGAAGGCFPGAEKSRNRKMTQFSYGHSNW